MISATYGLQALIRAARAFQIILTETQLSHAMGADCRQLDPLDICRAASYADIRAKWSKGEGQCSALPVPALLCVDGRWNVIESIGPTHWFRYDPETQQTHREPLPTPEEWSTMLVILLAEKGLRVGDVKFGLHWFIPSILRHRKQLYNVVSLSLVLHLVALVSPVLFQNVIDMVLVNRGLSSLQVLSLGMLGLAIADPVFGYLRGLAFSQFSSKVNSELSSRLYCHLIKLPLDYFCQRQTGQIVARIREMAHIRQFLTGSALMLVLDSAFIVMFLGVMFYYAQLLTWIVIIALVLYMLFWMTVGPMLRYRVNLEYDANMAATAYLTETLTGIETLKTTSTEPGFLRRWERILARQLRATFAANRVGIGAGQGINLIQKVSSACILYCGVKIVLEGELSPGGLVAFNMLSSHVTQPILRMAQMWQDFQHTLIALHRVGDILNTPSEAGREGVVAMPRLKGKIEFTHVRFRYQLDAPEVLQDLSFIVQAGEFIGITGPSGSGKSTLTRLLQRLYVPQHGQVLVDGMDLAIADPASLRRNMSVVLQENVLFSGTILDSIRFCSPESTEQEVIEASQLAGADSFIREFERGYYTYIGERGTGLSGGQRQRVALARALLANPRILILDEATSALDYESESAIMANMDRICHNRTVISIAHRLNTIRHANRILVIEQGRLTEQGTHEELLKLEQGLYAKLWFQQTG